ncbi:MAG: hypothetical protein HYY97_09630 [Rhodocyclales bacterium]|nr:hypothetical protein [Rhodocyclales bacterium]
MTERFRVIEDGKPGAGLAACLRVALLVLGLGLGRLALAQPTPDSGAGNSPAAPNAATAAANAGSPDAAADIESALLRLEDKYAIQEKEAGELKAKLLELEKSNLELSAGNRRLTQQLAAAREAGKRFSAELARRVYRNVSRHVATMAGTSIPYVGTGVSVGMAELDVKEGCATLGTLNELNRAMKLETVSESKVCTLAVPTQDEVMAQVLRNWRTAYAVAAAWANQDETTLPAEPPTVPQARANELWMAVFGAIPQAVNPPPARPGPIQPIAPTPPTPPTPPSIR